MLGEHRYELTTTWTGNRGAGTAGYRDYDRTATIEIAGKPALLASSDKPFRGDPARWNPEDLLVAALSEPVAARLEELCRARGAVLVMAGVGAQVAEPRRRNGRATALHASTQHWQASLSTGH